MRGHELPFAKGLHPLPAHLGSSMAKIHFHTLGCRLNQAESERMARSFRLAGHEIVDKADEADIRVVNTCTVTKNAGDDSRKAAHRRENSPANQRIVVTGCHSEVAPDEFAKADLVIPSVDKAELAALVQERFGLEGLALGMDTRAAQAERVYPLSLATTRAFVKIQDGCNLRCSFCLTTVARGVSRSRDAEEILTEIRELAAAGCQEAVLTGVHAGSYGLDIDHDFGWLIDRILNETEIPRIRLSSLEPWNFKEQWIELWSRYGHRLCRHLHMSLQSGSDTVLRRMNRHYDGPHYAERLNWARNGIPGIALTTDIIVGFPGETEDEHRASLDFVRESAFSGAHIFTYSPRPGTQAAKMPDHLDAATKKARFREMKAVCDADAEAFRHSLLDTEQQVLWEAEKKSHASGLTDTFVRVRTDAALASPNTITTTLMRRAEGNVLFGEPVESA